MKPKKGFEPLTPALRKRCSTVELLRRCGAKTAAHDRRIAALPAVSSLGIKRYRLVTAHVGSVAVAWDSPDIGEVCSTSNSRGSTSTWGWRRRTAVHTAM